MGGPRWHVFVAYASPDRARARVLYEALRAAGLSVAFDQDVLRPGDNWHRELPGHLRSSAIVAVLVSSHTAAATYENEEVVMAVGQMRREGGRVVPVRLHDGAELPYGTHALHAVDFFADEHAGRVAAALAGVVAHPVRAAELASTQVWCARIPGLPRGFAGRDALLEELERSTSGGADTVLTTVHGMGGVGKTSVAAALCDRRRHQLDVVWWVRAEQPSTLVADLAELASAVGAPVADDPADTALGARNWLENTSRPWLLVFDNAPDEESVEPWRPRRGHGATVVTSRNRNMSRLGEVVEVDTFPDDVAEAFLRSRVRPRNQSAAAEDLAPVLDRLVGLPLALEQAAAWVEQLPSRRFAHWVARFDEVAGEPFPDGTRPLGYQHTAVTAWRVSVEAALADAECAGRVLSILGFLAPDDLPAEWLRALARAGDPYLNASPDDVDAALAALHGYSLVEVGDADTVSTHRVIQDAARRTAPPEAAGAATSLLRAQVVGEGWNHTRWPILATLVPHALAALATSGPALPAHANDLCWVLADIAVYHRYRGATAAAIETGQKALELAMTHLGPDHPHTLASRNNLANAYQSAGDLARAIPLYEATLADCERVLGPDHPSTLTSRNNLAGAYVSAGDLARAVPLFEATLADRERMLGPDHQRTLTSRNNLAAANRSAGDLARAIPLNKATLADCKRVLGPDHPDTLMSRNNLAYAYESAGDLARAIPLYEATLADCERVLGPDHPQTRTTRDNLAVAQRERDAGTAT